MREGLSLDNCIAFQYFLASHELDRFVLKLASRTLYFLEKAISFELAVTAPDLGVPFTQKRVVVFNPHSAHLQKRLIF
jgi:hypothetical protein